MHRLPIHVHYRDVAPPHLQATTLDEPGARAFVMSGWTPFRRSDCEQLERDAPAVICERAPHIARAFKARASPFLRSIDRVCDFSLASDVHGRGMQFGPEQPLGQFDAMDFEVLPPEAKWQSEA